MKKFIILFLFILPAALLAQDKKPEKKVLMVLSSYGKDEGKTRPGYEFDELSQAYLVFRSNNLLVDIASPKGGKPEADQFNPTKPYNKEALSDKEFMRLLNHTIQTSAVDPDAYDAVYVVGGKGAMFDLPYDSSLQDLILNLYQRNNTVISSVCHGPAAFVNIKDGEDFIVKEVGMTGFCNLEEDLFGKKWVKEFPFKLEDKLIERGVKFEHAHFMLSHVVVSGKFVTGQNPFSTASSAEAVVRQLGDTPVARTPYPDELAMYLVEDLLNEKLSQKEAAGKILSNTAGYDMELMAVYGYYWILGAGEDSASIEKGIALIKLTAPHYFNENLQLFLASTYMGMDKKELARPILKELIEKDLLKDQALQLMGEING